LCEGRRAEARGCQEQCQNTKRFAGAEKGNHANLR
jgi:hypothetical protein